MVENAIPSPSQTRQRGLCWGRRIAEEGGGDEVTLIILGRDGQTWLVCTVCTCRYSKDNRRAHPTRSQVRSHLKGTIGEKHTLSPPDVGHAQCFAKIGEDSRCALSIHLHIARGPPGAKRPNPGNFKRHHRPTLTASCKNSPTESGSRSYTRIETDGRQGSASAQMPGSPIMGDGYSHSDAGCGSVCTDTTYEVCTKYGVRCELNGIADLSSFCQYT